MKLFVKTLWRRPSRTITVTYALVLLAASASAESISTSEYVARLNAARSMVSELMVLTGEADAGRRSITEEQLAAARLRAALPNGTIVDTGEQSIRADLSWGEQRLSAFENEDDSTRRAVYLTEIDEMLATLIQNLNNSQTAVRQNRPIDEDKRRLAEILSRPEYNSPDPKKSNTAASLFERFFDWFRSLFGESDSRQAAPYDFASFTRLLQIVLLIAVLAVVGYLLYKFAMPSHFGIRRGLSSKKSHRTILGERIAPDAKSDDLFGEAERLARGGDLRGAIRKGYIALLCELSDRGIVQIDQSKTNRDYILDVSGRQPLSQIVTGLTSIFERQWYGKQPSAEADWNEFEQKYKKAVSNV